MNVIKKPSKIFYQTTLFTSLMAYSYNSFAAGPAFIPLTESRTDIEYSYSGGVSDDGLTVVGTAEFIEGSGEVHSRAFRWKNGKLIKLDLLPGGTEGEHDGFGISGDGSVLTGRGSAVVPVPNSVANRSIRVAWKWTEAHGTAALDAIDWDSFAEFGKDASYDGSVITGNFGRAFRWTEEAGPIMLPNLPSGEHDPFTVASSISADGKVIVGRSEGLEYGQPVRWTEDDVLALGTFEGDARAVSTNGRIIFGTGNVNRTDSFFRWTQETGAYSLDIDVDPLSVSSIYISASGEVMVGGGGRDIGPFIWDAENGKRDLRDVLDNEYNLDLSGWVLQNVSGVSSDGNVIVGSGLNPSRITTAWMVRLAPMDKPLKLSLLAPHNGRTLFTTTPLVLEGLAQSSVAGDITTQIVWSSDIDGELGVGGRLPVNLSAGEHTITGKITNQGQIETVTSNVVVLEEPELTLDIKVSNYWFFSVTRISWLGATNNIELLKNGELEGIYGASGRKTFFGSANNYQICQVKSDRCTKN